jgi:hypothetical protein
MPRVICRWCFAQFPVVRLDRMRARSLRNALKRAVSRMSIFLIPPWQNLQTFFRAGRLSRLP